MGWKVSLTKLIIVQDNNGMQIVWFHSKVKTANN